MGGAGAPNLREEELHSTGSAQPRFQPARSGLPTAPPSPPWDPTTTADRPPRLDSTAANTGGWSGLSPGRAGAQRPESPAAGRGPAWHEGASPLAPTQCQLSPGLHPRWGINTLFNQNPPGREGCILGGNGQHGDRRAQERSKPCRAGRKQGFLTCSLSMPAARSGKTLCLQTQNEI